MIGDLIMNIIVSQLPFVAYSLGQMAALPPEYGIEIFIEHGNSYLWDHTIPEVLKERFGLFSIHGPFVKINLASPDIDWAGIIENYKWTFEYCRKYNAVHCVLHPNADFPEGVSRVDAQSLSLERVEYLSRLAMSYGVELLVENMPYRNEVFNQEEFAGLFSQIKTIGFLIDTGHALITQWDMDKLIACLNSRIKAYHIHDNHGDADKHLKVGEGNINWSGFFANVKRYSPEAVLVLEYNTGPIDEIVKNIEFIKQYL